MRRFLLFIAALLMSVGVTAKIVSAATPSGFSSVTLVVNAQVTANCQEAQHGSFPNPITIDAQSGSDVTYKPSADEIVKCTNGTVFTVKVSSANGTALNQTCTSSGVSAMALTSAGAPTDKIAYTFYCSGDTDGSGHFVGAGFGTARSLGISVKILAADAQSSVAHADYMDSVTLTISY